MKSTHIFIFGVVNFSLLMAWLFWFVKKNSRQYFYARKMVIRKQMTSSAKMLQEAKQRSSKVRKLLNTLDDDIANRRNALLKNSTEDCSVIIENANLASKMILESIIRQTKEDRRKALLDVRNEILRNAFAQAETTFKEKMTPEMKKQLNEAGFSELPQIIKAPETQAGGAEVLK